jgi:hypothetical protein
MKKVLLFTAAILSSACFPLPNGPGANLNGATVVVRDQSSNPMGGVRVTFQDWNSSGLPFMVSSTTANNGELFFAFREPGARKCEIQPPAGYVAGPDGLSQTVDILRAKTVIVTFTLVRAPSAP